MEKRRGGWKSVDRQKKSHIAEVGKPAIVESGEGVETEETAATAVVAELSRTKEGALPMRTAAGNGNDQAPRRDMEVSNHLIGNMECRTNGEGLGKPPGEGPDKNGKNRGREPLNPAETVETRMVGNSEVKGNGMVFATQASNKEKHPTLAIRGGFPSGTRPTKRVRLKRKKTGEDCNGDPWGDQELEKN